MANNSSVSAKQARYGATAMLYVIVVLAILVAINWLANRYNQSADLTANKQYTLSDETKKVVKNLSQPVSITYFDRKSGFSSAKPLLDRYANLSRKIHVQYVDYTSDPATATAYGVRTAGTAFVQVGSRREEARALTEEGITGALLKDLKGVRTVCVVQGSGELSFDGAQAGGLSRFKELVQRDNYQSQAISLLQKNEVPKECTVLVVAGPRFDYTQGEVDAIKNYVEHGGRAFFLLDPPLNFGRETIASNDALTGLLASWGVTLDKDLVLEQNPIGQMLGIGPEVPLVHDYTSQPIVSDLSQNMTGFRLARSLDVKNTDKTTVEKLFSTSADSIATVKLNTPEVNAADPNNKKGPFALGAAGTYNTGDPKNPGRFVVIGSASLVSNEMLHFQANPDLALNAINWLSSDEDLISIRPKPAEDRRLTMNQSQSNLFTVTDLYLLPLLIIALGVATYLKRR